jgi:hypothetical protein
MTTLAADKARTWEIGERNEFPVIASDTIYEGAAVGVVLASGHARPLTSDDLFVGFAEKQADNSSGNAADINVRVVKKGSAVLPVTGAVITDINLPVYAQDDDTFSFIKTSGVFIGFSRRYVSSDYMVVEFDAGVLVDPHEGLLAETVSANKTLNNEDTGKVFFVDTNDKTITLPAVAPMAFRIVNAGAYGTVAVDVAPNASDLMISKGEAGTDSHGLINTKTTACRGDYIDIEYGDATGWIVTAMRGTWADTDNT